MRPWSNARMRAALTCVNPALAEVNSYVTRRQPQGFERALVHAPFDLPSQLGPSTPRAGLGAMSWSRCRPRAVARLKKPSSTVRRLAGHWGLTNCRGSSKPPKRPTLGLKASASRGRIDDCGRSDACYSSSTTVSQAASWLATQIQARADQFSPVPCEWHPVLGRRSPVRRHRGAAEVLNRSRWRCSLRDRDAPGIGAA